MSSVRVAAASAVKWNSVGTSVVLLLGLMQTAIMARLLTPADFGLVAMLTLPIALLQAFLDCGIGNVIVCRQDLTHRQLSTLYWLTLAMACVAGALLMLLLPAIVMFFNEPRLRPLLPGVVSNVLLNALGQQFAFLHQRELRFQVIAKIEMISAAVGLVIATVCAGALDLGAPATQAIASVSQYRVDS